MQLGDPVPGLPETTPHNDGKERSADEERWGMRRAELEKRILRLYKGGTGILKIGKTLGIGTALVQRLVMEQPRPLEAGASV